MWVVRIVGLCYYHRCRKNARYRLAWAQTVADRIVFRSNHTPPLLVPHPPLPYPAVADVAGAVAAVDSVAAVDITSTSSSSQTPRAQKTSPPESTPSRPSLSNPA